MSQPIRPVPHALPRDPSAVPVGRPAPAPRGDLPNRNPSSPSQRRSDAADRGDDKAADANDGLFFEQLLGTDPGARQGDDDDGDGSTAEPQNLPALSPAGMARLVDELAQHLPAGGPEDFTATLFMPNLGRIGLKASRSAGRWNINLGFANSSAQQRVQQVHEGCQQALATTLGCPVDLRLHAL